MITLHHEKETDFSTNGYGMLDNLFNETPEGEWELNGVFKISFTIPYFSDVEKTQYLTEQNIIQAPVPFMDRQLFRIYRSEKSLGYVHVEARHIFYDLLDNWVEDTNVVGQSGNLAVQQILNNTHYGHRFTGSSNITNTANARVVRMNPVEALLDDSRSNSFVNRWGGELVRDNFHIEMLSRRGTNRGVKIRHKYNLTGYEASFDWSTVITKIRPVGFDGLTLPEVFVDSPLMDEEHPIIAEIEYRDVKAAVGEYADDDDAIPLEEAYNELRRLAALEFSEHHVDEPESSINVNFLQLRNMVGYEDLQELQEVRAGDTVEVLIPEENFEVTSRLVGFKWNPLEEDEYTSTTLGNHVREFTSSNQGINAIRQEIEDVREQAIAALQSANGRNTNWDGEANPNDLDPWDGLRLGDIYFQENGEYQIMYRYVEVAGERYWREIVNTQNDDEVARLVNEALEEMETLKTDVEQEMADVRNEVEREIERVSGEFEEEFNILDSQLQDTRDRATEANKQINDAIQNAGFTSLTDTISYVDGLANTAEANAQTALSRAIDAHSLADDSINQSQDALSSANNAVGLAQDASSLAEALSVQVSDFELTVDGFSQTVNNYEDQVAQFTSDVNGLNSTVASYESQVDEFGNTVTTYATQVSEFENTVSGLNSTVSSYQSDVNGYQSQVATLTNTVDGFNATVQRVEADYGNLSGTVQSLGASIDVVEGQITNKVWQTDIQSAVDGIDIQTRNLIIRHNEEEGTFHADGREDNSSYNRSRTHGFIEVSSGESLVFFKTPTDLPSASHNVWRVNWYDEDENFVSRFPEFDDEFTTVVPSGVSKLRVSYPREANVMIQRGSKFTGWQPAPEDTLQLISHVETEWKQAAQGFEQSITQIESDVSGKASLSAFNTLESTVDSTIQRIGDAEGNITQIEANVSGLQTTVSNKANQTEVTQLADGFNVLSRSFDDMEIGGRNLVIRSTEEKGTLINQSGQVGSGTNHSTSDYIPVTPNTDYMFTKSDSNLVNDAGFFRWAWYDEDKSYISRRANSSNEFLWTTPNNVHYVRVSYPDDSYPKFEKGNKATDWTPAPEDMATQAQLAVISNEIDMAVSNGDVIGRINVQAGQTLIQNNTLFLDAPTVTFSGHAFIPSAAIEELEANKIIGNEGDFNYLFSELMEFNLIQGEHIEVDNVLIDKFLSAESGFIRELVSEQAFIEQLNTSNLTIDMGRVHGTLEYNRLTGIAIDANDIVTGTLNAGNRSSWNLLTGTFQNSGDWATLRIQDGSLGFYGANTGQYLGGFEVVRYSSVDTTVIEFITGSPSENNLRFSGNSIQTTLRDSRTDLFLTPAVGGRVQVRSRADNPTYYGVNAADYILNGRSRLTELDSGTLYIQAENGLQLRPRSGEYFLSFSAAGVAQYQNRIDMNMNDIVGIDNLRFGPSNSGEVFNTNTNELGLRHTSAIRFYQIANGSSVQRMSIAGNINAFTNLNMNGNNVANVSDGRFKKVIRHVDDNVLNMYENLDFVDFEYTESDKPKGVHFGLIAQEADRLGYYDEKAKRWMISQNDQVMYNSLGIKQLVLDNKELRKRVDYLEKELEGMI